MLQVKPTVGGWLLTVEGGDHVKLLDERLQLRREVAIPTPVRGYVYPHISVDPTGTIFAVSYQTGLRVFSAAEDGQLRLLWQAGRDDPPWPSFNGSDCVIDRGSRVWWVRRNPSGTDRVVVSDARTGETIAEGRIKQFGCRYHFDLHPDGDAAILDGAAGQDGSFLWRLDLRATGSWAQELGSNDRIMGGFSADGTRYVTAPHQGDAICIHGWPEGAIIDRIEAASVFLDETEAGDAATDAFCYQAQFLDERHVIADTRQRRLLLLSVEPLTAIAELWPEGYEIRGYDTGGQPIYSPLDGVDYEGDLDSWVVVGDRLLTTHLTGALKLWDLASLMAGESPGPSP